jgi:hypothetical protein
MPHRRVSHRPRPPAHPHPSRFLAPALQLTPVMEDPPCSRCPMDLAGKPAPRKVPCPGCGSMRMALYDLASDQLQVRAGAS